MKSPNEVADLQLIPLFKTSIFYVDRNLRYWFKDMDGNFQGPWDHYHQVQQAAYEYIIKRTPDHD